MKKNILIILLAVASIFVNSRSLWRTVPRVRAPERYPLQNKRGYKHEIAASSSNGASSRDSVPPAPAAAAAIDPSLPTTAIGQVKRAYKNHPASFINTTISNIYFTLPVPQ